MAYRHDWSEALAPPGYFQDINTGLTHQFLTPYGFDYNAFDQAVPLRNFYATALTVSAIEAAVKQAHDAGGGIVHLPAGEARITQIEIHKRERILLQGAGRGRTVLQMYNPGSSAVAIELFDCQHFVMRDFTLEALTTSALGIENAYNDNVLFHRLEVIGFRSANINMKYTQRITASECRLTGATENHGFACKDVFEPRNPPDWATLSYCESRFGSPSAHPHGVLFSEMIKVHSCELGGNEMYGVNMHGTYFEICGNDFGGPLGPRNIASKQFDGWEGVFWLNKVNKNLIFGSMAQTIHPSVRNSGRIRIFANTFGGGNIIKVAGTTLGSKSTDYHGDHVFIIGDNDWGASPGKIVNSSGVAASIALGAGTNAGSQDISGGTVTASSDWKLTPNPPLNVTTLPDDSGCGADNLVRNGDFTGGTEDWFFDGAGASTFVAEEGYADLDILTGESWTLQSTSFFLENGERYRVAVNVSGDDLSLPVRVTDGTTVYWNTTLALQAHPNQFGFYFDMTVDVDEAWVEFDFASLVGAIQIGGVCVRPVGDLVASFTLDSNTGAGSLTVQFTDGSTSPDGDPITSWVWKANGAVFSTAQNPSRTFTLGWYDISLTVRSASGAEDTLVMTDAIYVRRGALAGGDMTLVAQPGAMLERRTTGFDVGLTAVRTYHEVGLIWSAETTIPDVATIEEAWVEMRSEGTASTPHAIIFRLENASAPAAYSTVDNWDSRQWRSTNVSWTPGTWADDTWYRTGELKTLIQDYIDTWGALTAGTRISFRLKDEVDTSNYTKWHTADNLPEYGAKLYVRWTVPAQVDSGAALGAGLAIGMRGGIF